MEIADRDGIEAVTMRRLGDELGVEAMSLYHHVANKDEVVAGMVDLLLGEIPLPASDVDWRAAIRERAMSASAVMARHPWGPGILGTRRGPPSPAVMRYMDWAVGVMRDAGFAPVLIHSAIHLVASRLFGFNDEAFSDGVRPDQAKALGAVIRIGDYPAIAAVVKGLHHDDKHEFAFGLDLILDGLERMRRVK
jgi:AcrR family transcriptional regulator